MPRVTYRRRKGCRLTVAAKRHETARGEILDFDKIIAKRGRRDIAQESHFDLQDYTAFSKMTPVLSRQKSCSADWHGERERAGGGGNGGGSCCGALRGQAPPATEQTGIQLQTDNCCTPQQHTLSKLSFRPAPRIESDTFRNCSKPVPIMW